MNQRGAGITAKGGQKPTQPQARPNPYANMSDQGSFGRGGGFTQLSNNNIPNKAAPQQSANKPTSSFNPSTGRMEYASQPGNFSRSSQRPARRGRGGKGGMQAMGAMRKNTPTGFKMPRNK
jgi:hypothetical protein